MASIGRGTSGWTHYWTAWNPDTLLQRVAAKLKSLTKRLQSERDRATNHLHNPHQTHQKNRLHAVKALEATVERIGGSGFYGLEGFFGMRSVGRCIRLFS